MLFLIECCFECSERELNKLRRQRSHSLAQMKDFESTVSDLKRQLGIADDGDNDGSRSNSPMPFSRQWRRRSTDAALKVNEDY